MSQQWSLYLLRCADGSLYTGISTDVERRLAEHRGEKGKALGAKALRGKQPLELVFQTQLENQSVALKMEYKVKQLSRRQKEKLITGSLPLPQL